MKKQLISRNSCKHPYSYAFLGETNIRGRIEKHLYKHYIISERFLMVEIVYFVLFYLELLIFSLDEQNLLGF
jgi:hypothetical protein